MLLIETSAAAALVAPPVQTLPVEEFIAAYSPMYYAGTWQEIHDDTDPDRVYDDPSDPEGKYDDHFLASGTSGMDFDDLVCSIADSGVTAPVDIVDGEVEDGHHRVVAAMIAKKPVPFRIWS